MRVCVVWTFLLSSILSLLSPSLWETARYRLKYFLKGPLNPKQPTNQPSARLPLGWSDVRFDIRSKLDYGSIVYGSARKSYLQMLDTVHHQGLRLALGAFRTSPVTSLHVEADEPSLYLRREKLSLQYAIRLAANQRNPAFKVTFSPQFLELYEHNPNAIKPFGLRISPLLESSNINANNIEKHFITDIPPWCIRKPNILFDLHTSKKTVSNSNILKQNFQVLQSRYRVSTYLY